MHDVIQNDLEEYFSGAASRAFHTHLEKCGDCRQEVQAMHEVSGLFKVLQSPEPPDLAPGFYYRVSQRVASQQKPSFWSGLSFEPAFARRIVFSSLMTLALLGSYLISRENASLPAADTPSAIMARHDSSVQHENGNDRGRMLVTLASYEH